jgi:tetratricopeptide (TPR) repeat protein
MRCRVGLALVCGALIAACAARTPPPLPTVLQYPEFLYPAVPASLARGDAADRIDIGWRFLQGNDLRSADREFSVALKRFPTFHPAHAGAAYVALARGDHQRALAGFDAALRAAPTYVPALVGRGQALLAVQRDAEALTAFEAALTADASLLDVRRRVDVLRFRSLQQVIEAARAAAAAGRVEESRATYQRALTISPDSAFLHRELALLERKQGNAQEALAGFRRASDLDSADVVSLVQIGELLENQQDFAGAEAAYRRAETVEPSADLRARIAALGEKARDARLPAEFRAISSSPHITRGELAVLVGVRLEDLLRGVPAREVVTTDTQGHWAADWIAQVARAGVMEPFANHTFQPANPINRGDLAAAVSRVATLIAARRPELRSRLADRVPITDMPAGHLSYPAASVAVSLGVVPLLEGSRFEIARPVSGAEAAAAVARLRALADGAR